MCVAGLRTISFHAFILDIVLRQWDSLESGGQRCVDTHRHVHLENASAGVCLSFVFVVALCVVARLAPGEDAAPCGGVSTGLST